MALNGTFNISCAVCVCICVQALVFDFGGEVYLWLGKDVPVDRQKVALQLSQQVWLGAYDYRNCLVNPMDPTQKATDTQLYDRERHLLLDAITQAALHVTGLTLFIRPGWVRAVPAGLSLVSCGKTARRLFSKISSWTGQEEEEKMRERK